MSKPVTWKELDLTRQEEPMVGVTSVEHRRGWVIVILRDSPESMLEAIQAFDRNTHLW